MKRIILLSLLAAVLLAGCKPAQLLVDNDLSKRTTAMKVSGRQGWKINQKVSFGPYRTDRISRGWIRGYDIPFFIRFKGASQRYSFRQHNDKGQDLEVFCVNKLTSRELDFFSDVFSATLEYKSAFSGKIVDPVSDSEWTFILENPDGEAPARPIEGWLTDGTTTYQVKGILQLGKKRDTSWGSCFGYEILEKNGVVAAVETVNKGRVWIDPALPEKQQLALAAMSTALLIRENLDDTAN